MLVQCPSCSARYKVNDANIPPTGGKIRCPKCSHTFVVYPEASEPVDATQIAPMGGYDEAATSIADIASLMKGGAPGGGPPQQEEEGATEIMSGDSIPDFASMFNGGGPPEDGTVEMQNPLELLQKAGWNAPGGGAPGVGAPEEDGATEIVSADMVFGGGPPPGGQQAGGAPAPGQPRPRSKTQFGGWNAQDVAAAGAQQAQPAPQQPAPQQPALSPPQPAGGFGGGDPFAGVDMGGPAPTPEQPPAPAAPAAAAGPNPNHQGPWKLKTSFGLTYEFQDTKSLLGWMSSRDDLSGYSLSEGTESFYPIEQFPQVMGQLSGAGARSLSGQVGAVSPAPTPAPAPAGGQPGGFGGQPGGDFGGQPSGFGGAAGGQAGGFGGQPGGFGGQPGGFGGPMGGGEPPRQPGQKIENNEFKPPSKSKGKSLTAILVALFLVFGGVAIVFSLHLAKIIDIKALISGEPAEVEQPEQPPSVEAKAPDDGAEASGGDEAEEPEIDEATKKEVDQMISDARDELENNKLMSALSKLKTAKMLDPNRFEVYDMLADVHEQMGEADKAAEVREEVKKLRAAGSATP